MHLYPITHTYLEALSVLTDSEDLPEEAIADTLSALQGDIESKVINVVCFTKGVEADIDAIKNLEAQLAERRKKLEKRLDIIKQNVLHNMEIAEIQKIECPYFKIAPRNNPPKVVIETESLIPDDFLETKQVTIISKTKIKKAIEEGMPVPGARLIVDKRLDVR